MSLFYPKMLVNRISDITPETLGSIGVCALILDVDNTLTTPNNPVPDKDVLLWLERIKAEQIPLVIASNNYPRRVAPFAKTLGLDYAAMSLKPLPFGFLRISKRLHVRPGQIGVVGDQIFTDVLGANLFGAKSILVRPMRLETGAWFRVRRWLEERILDAYRAKHHAHASRRDKR